VTDFREALIAAGITNGTLLAEHMQAPAAIFFLVGRSGLPVAELRSWDDQRRKTVSLHRPDSHRMSTGDARRMTVEAAKAEALKRLSVMGWSRAPFSNCWLPTDVLKAARREFLGEQDAPTA
jgi:hypothetical protein